MKLNEKKVCVFTNYRTGSSKLCEAIINKNNLPGLSEYFRTTNIGYSHLFSYEKAIRNYKSMNSFVLKLMSDHVHHDTNKITEILDRSDKIIYLYRRNFKAQALSWLAADSTASYSDLKKTSGNPIEIKVPVLSKQYIDESINLLMRNYISMGYFLKKYSGEVICLEDMSEKNPYTRIYKWTGELPTIPDFDVERAIFGNGLD